MSNLETAFADSAIAQQTHVREFQTKTRTILYQGGVVSIKIPMDAKKETASMTEDGPLQYLRFHRSIPGGVVFCFLHAPDLDAHLGRTVHAEPKIMKRVLQNGREYVYVDFHLVPRETPATHRFVVMPSAQIKDPLGDEYMVFFTPAPQKGIILLGPIDAKMPGFNGNTVQSVPVLSKVSAEPKATPLKTTGDGQLDRLVQDGWEIKWDDGTTVTLSKGTRTMTHKRQKKKSDPQRGDKNRR